MTKAAAFNAFLCRIMPSYDAASVPKNVKLPYQTYEYREGTFYDGPVSITVNQWSQSTTGETEANRYVNLLSEEIGMSGTVIPCDGGAIWIKRGSPWSQSIKNEIDPNVKRRYINVTVEFLTPN